MPYPPVVIPRQDFDTLLTALRNAGYLVIGPTISGHAITLAPLQGVEDLPIGWGDRQDGGHYELYRRADAALFGYNLGQASWKKFLYPPRATLFEIRRHDGSLQFEATAAPRPRYAFLGVRACELAAIAIQDRVFMGGGPPDPGYGGARRDLLTVAVNCASAGGTCFCASMGTGPAVTTGYDIALTELIEGGRHDFLCEAGSATGSAIVDAVRSRPATASDLALRDHLVATAAASMGRTLETDRLEVMLQANPEHPEWEAVASRCLACANCTLVCPTCFCSTIEDRVSLDTGVGERSRRWDSCFSLEFTNLHGVPVRTSTRARYRQWMTHKLSSWYEQFGTSGCVGCGRCITWCPVGIDITQEAATIRSQAGTAWT